MKVTLVSSMNPWNDIRIYKKIASSLTSRYEVEYLFASDLTREEFKENEIKFKGIKKRRSKIGRIFKLVNIFKSIEKSEFILITNPDLLLLVPFLKYKYRDTHFIYDMHEDFEEAFQDKLPRIGKMVAAIYGITLRRMLTNNILTHVFVTTPLIKEKFSSYKNVSIIENYAPVFDNKLKVRHTSNEQFKLVFHGSMGKIRGIEKILYAIEELYDVEVHLVGTFTASYKEEIQNLAIELNIKDRVFILDSMDYEDLITYLSKMDVGIISYLPLKNHIVTRPNKLFEYMSVGLPIICSDFPLYREVVENQSGLTYDPNNHEELKSCILELKKNKVLYNFFSETGRKLYLEKYNWNIEEEKLMKIFTKMEAK